MKPIKWTKEYFQLTRQNNRLLLAFLILIPVMIALIDLYWANYISVLDRTLCLADSIVFLSYPQFYPFTMVLLSVYFTFHLLKYDLELSVMIRQKSKQSIWIKQFFKGTLSSFFTTLYITICACLIGFLMTDGIMNWTSEKSFFAKALDMFPFTASIWQVIGLFFLTSLLMMISINVLILLLKWITNHDMVGWIVMISLFIIDYTGIGNASTPIYYRIFCINFPKFLNPKSMVAPLLYPLLIIILFLGIGLFVAKRKDFLSVHQK